MNLEWLSQEVFCFETGPPDLFLKEVLDYTMLEFHSYVGSIEYMVRLKERSQPTKSFKTLRETLYEILLNMSN